MTCMSIFDGRTACDDLLLRDFYGLRLIKLISRIMGRGGQVGIHNNTVVGCSDER